MRIYLLERERGDYDEASGMVVVAQSAGAARKLAATEAADEGPKEWRDAGRSTCNRIGTAPASARARVVLQHVRYG